MSMKRDFMFTSESVTEGHPDKLCDLISDAVLDHFLQQDPFSRIITECAVSSGILFIAARFASQAKVDIPDVARRIISQVGYEQKGFNARDCTILTSFTELPALSRIPCEERDLSDAELDRVVARNQANVFGYACQQTAALMPLPIWLSHKLARRLASVRLQRQLNYLAPDGTIQVGVEYRDRRPARVHSITVIASQWGEQIGLERLRDDIVEHVIEPVFVDEVVRPDRGTRIVINPDGPFVTGGPALHSGLTGRKNAVDTYGEYSRHSGSALSGKDPSRIDRVGAYAARHAAKNVVAAGLAEECEVQLSYSIGLAQPVSVQIETFGTGRVAEEDIIERVRSAFDFRPAAIVRDLNLRHMPQIMRGGFYRRLATYGQVGRMDIGLPWEATDMVTRLR
jgi:S-adenosylmethionine synthetase